MKKNKKKFHLDKWLWTNKFYLLAFLLPAISMLIIFAIKSIVPFGDGVYIRSDCYHQYTPYLQILHDKLHSGGSMLFTWEIGGGMNFMAIAAYYLASPLNLLTAIWPWSMAHITDFFIVLKIGLSGFAMTYFLTKRFNRSDATPLAFGLAYALSGYFAAYSWNIMWLDCMWIFPLVILGLEKLVKEGKILMYTITLGLSIISNYYIGIMICIFSVIYFFYLFITHSIVGVKSEETLAEKAKRQLMVLVRYGVSSLIAGGLAAIVVLPEYLNLQLTKSAQTTFPEDITEYFSVPYMFLRSLITVPVADLKYAHDPNIYCSVAIFILIPMFWFCKKISIRERVGKTILMGIMLLSFNINVLDYLWHGMHFPNSLPCRQSFIYIFLILTMAYEVLTHVKDMEYKHIIGSAAGAIGLLLLFEQIFDTSKIEFFTTISIPVTMVRLIFLSITFIVIYAILLGCYKCKPSFKPFFTYVMILVVFCELTINMNITSIPDTQNVDAYYDKNEITSELNDLAKKQSDKEGVVFYRTEMKEHDTRNNGARYDYNSISTFSSVCSAAMQDFYKDIGMQQSFNAYSYLGHTPVTASLFSVKYEYAPANTPSIPNQMKEILGKKANATLSLYEYNNTLPLGFMVNKNNWNIQEGNPFDVQNEFIKQSTNVDSDVFRKLSDASSEKETFKVEYESKDKKAEKPDKLDVYFYCQTSNNSLSVSYTSDGQSKSQTFSATDQNYICHLPNVDYGTPVTITGTGSSENQGEGAEQSAAITSCLAYAFESNIWQEAYSELNSQGLKVTEFEDTNIKGEINSKKDGIMLTSIPYDTGWSVYVDGKEVEPVQLFSDKFIHEEKKEEATSANGTQPTTTANKEDERTHGALLGVELSPGKHDIELKYTPSGLIPGLLISLLSLALLIVLKKFKVLEPKDVMPVQTK